MNFLEILSPPDDGSILIADRMVNFTAQIDRPERSSEIEWSRASDPKTRVRGSSVSFEWTATGVDQVVATIDGLTCAVVVYVFKTPNGGSTLADIMRSEPPPVARSVADFTPHPKRTLRSVS